MPASGCGEASPLLLPLVPLGEEPALWKLSFLGRNAGRMMLPASRDCEEGPMRRYPSAPGAEMAGLPFCHVGLLSAPLTHGLCLFHCFVLLPLAVVFFSCSGVADSLKNRSGIFLTDVSSEGLP